MSADTELPGHPGPRLLNAWARMDDATREAFRPHLLGDTPAEYLADWLHRAKTPASASTIRTYRRSLARHRGAPWQPKTNS